MASAGTTDSERVRVPAHPIVFFDGVCGLCNRAVDRLLRWDRHHRLRFAPLQGETARALLPSLDSDAELWSLVYVDERGRHERSDAVLAVFRRLGGVFRLLGLARFVPRMIRDALYRFVACRRYRWFRKRDSCRVPAPDEQQWFLP